MKISGIYKISNKITNDCYIGSSKDIEKRWYKHTRPSAWKQCPNNPLYLDFQKYGLESFLFEIVEETDNLKEMEQYWIEQLSPSYNDRYAKGHNEESYKEYRKKWTKEYRQTEKGKESARKATKKYGNQLCFYNGETLKIFTLACRFQRQGISHPVLEAKKYLIK